MSYPGNASMTASDSFNTLIVIYRRNIFYLVILQRGDTLLYPCGRKKLAKNLHRILVAKKSLNHLRVSFQNRPSISHSATTTSRAKSSLNPSNSSCLFGVAFIQCIRTTTLSMQFVKSWFCLSTFARRVIYNLSISFVSELVTVEEEDINSP